MIARLSLRPALFVVVLAALAISLGGCGRKGRLDLPPQAAADPAAAAVLDDEDEPVVAAERPLPTDSPQVAAAKARKRRIILDNILD